jgi:adenylate cyclase class 2
MQEVEIKFRISDLRSLKRALRKIGFHLATGRTHEMNTLYDLTGNPLRRRGELLRLRQYGKVWTVTFKSRARLGRHKSRTEIETRVADGPAFAAILLAAGFKPAFAYEKFRTEFTDARGHVVIDETPIGVFGEIEGPPRWIDSIASKLQIEKADYLTDSYAGLFFQWKLQTKSKAENMLYAEVKKKRP